MTRRPSRALARHLALALSIMLIGSTLALPALADGGGFGIISPGEGDEFGLQDTLRLDARAQAGFTGTPQWALRQGSDAAGQGAAFTRAGNVDGFSTPLEPRDDGTYFIDIEIADLDLDLSDFEVGSTTYKGTDFFFVFNTGSGNRAVREFTIVPIAGFDPDDEVVTCDAEDEDCTITQGGFTASTDVRGKDGGSAFLGLRVAGADDGVPAAVSAACDAAVTQVNLAARLGPDVVQLVPLNFEAGSITVQSTIPRSFVNRTVARGAGIFQVCVAAESEEYGGFSGLPPIAGTPLFGPVILGNCTDASTSAEACVLNKTKVGGDVILTYQLPTEDPWLK
jgi:hypothetical protein